MHLIHIFLDTHRCVIYVSFVFQDGSNNEIMERLKILAEFQGVSEYQVFMASMNKEREIKQKVKDLMR